MENYTAKVYYDGRFKLTSELYNSREELIGYFSLNFYDQYQLEVDICEEYQGRGLSKVLLNNFAIYLLNCKKGDKYILFDSNTPRILNDYDILAIDSDASENSNGKSWWSKIGMIENRYYDRKNPKITYKGYEKIITLGDLLKNIRQ